MDLLSLRSPEHREQREQRERNESSEPSGALVSLEQAKCVLFDFDGPICRLFAGYSAPRIARQVKRACKAEGVALPRRLARSRDPHGILWRLPGVLAADRPLADKAVGLAESVLSAGELRAADSAEPTSGAAGLIRTLHERGMMLAVVSNNSSSAINHYLRLHGLTSMFGGHVYGRQPDPGLMKPDPDCLLRALDALGAWPGQCVMIGDSGADVRAAAAIKEIRDEPVGFIGYARNRRKARILRDAGALVLAGSMDQLHDAFDS